MMKRTSDQKGNVFGAVLGICALLGAYPAAAQHYKVKTLTLLPQGMSGYAYGINKNNQIAGASGTGVSDSSGELTHAILWNADGTLNDLGLLSGGTYTQGQAINSNGLVIGFGDNLAGNMHGVVWDSLNGLRDLGALVGDDLSEAYGVNDAGQIVGASDVYLLDSTTALHACLWDADLTLHDLGTLPGGNYSAALAINSAGQVVGQSDTAGGEYHGFLRDSISGMTDLGKLAGGTYSYAYAINDRGQIAGYGDDDKGKIHLLSWDDKLVLHDLGVTAQTDKSGSLVSLNNLGQMTGTLGSLPFFYAGKTIDPLTDFVRNAPSKTLFGQAINDNAWIVGYRATSPSSASAQAIALTPYSVLTKLVISPNGVKGGVMATATATIDYPAPPGGAVVRLVNANPNAISITGQVTILAGATSATFPVVTLAVPKPVPARILAYCDGSSASAQITIAPPVLKTFSVSPTSLVGGASTIGQVTLDAPAPMGGLKVSLYGGNRALSVPSSVTVPGGAKTASFTAVSHPVKSSTTVTLYAMCNGALKSVEVVVTR